MMPTLDLTQEHRSDVREAHMTAMIAYLRSVVCTASSRQERFHAIFLDDRHTYLGDAGMGQGGHATLSLRMRELFARALTVGAHGMILAHNHPSGDCRPSRRDISSTQRLVDIGRALDVELIDHLIITHGSVYSMRAGGIL